MRLFLARRAVAKLATQYRARDTLCMGRAPASLSASFLFRAVVVASIVFLLALSLVSKGATRIYTWPWSFYTDVLCLTPIALLGWRLIRCPTTIRGGFPLVFLAATLGVSVATSRFPHFSLEATLPLWGGLAATWLTADLLHHTVDQNIRKNYFRIAGAFFSLPLALGLAWWLQDMQQAARIEGWRAVIETFTYRRNPHPLGHWNYTAAFGLLALPWLVTLISVETGRWRATWFACTVVAGLSFLSASSRGAVLGAVAMVVAAGIFHLLRSGISRRKKVIAGAGILAGAVVLIGTNPRLRTLALHPQSVFAPSAGDVQRLAMLQGGIELAKERPLVGHGPGTTPFVYPEVRGRLLGGVDTSFQLHSTALQIQVDEGILGVAAVLTIVWMALAATRAASQSPAGLQRQVSLGSAAALVGYFVFSFTDYQLNAPPLVAALGWHAGNLFAIFPDEPIRRGRRFLGVALLTAFFLSAVLMIPIWRGRELFWSAWQQTGAELIAGLRAAAAAAPWEANYRNQLGFQLGLRAQSTRDPVVLRSAREELARSLELNPAQEPVHAALGWWWLDEDPQKARLHFARAIRLLPDRETLHLGHALASLHLGDRSSAARDLAVESLLSPAFLVSPLWSRPQLSDMRAETLRELDRLARAPDSAEQVVHAQHDRWSYLHALARWLDGGRPPADLELVGATGPQRAFFESLERKPPSDLTSWPAALTLLESIRRSPDKADEILSSALPPGSEPIIEGARARLMLKPTSLNELIRAPSPAGEGLTQNRTERLHLLIMQRNLDGPGYPDFAPGLKDEFSAYFIRPLWPEKASLPGGLLLEFAPP